MIEIIYSPRWFYGKDIAIDIVSIAVLLLITLFSIRSYLLSRKGNYLKLGASFFMLAFSFIFKILMNFTIYYEIIETRNIGFVQLTYKTLRSTDTLFFVGFLVFRLLTLLGLYILYSIHNRQSFSDYVLAVFFIALTTYSAQSSYYVFHLAALILLAMITNEYFDKYRKNRLGSTKLLTFSFMVMTLSQVSFMFIRFNQQFYVVGEFVQLTSYVLLLITFIMVLIHGKKKVKA